MPSGNAPSINELRDAAEVATMVAAASEAGVFQALAQGAATPAEVASSTEIDGRAAGILLPALAEAGLLARAEGRFRLMPDAARQLTQPDSPAYVAGGLGLWLHNLRAMVELPTVLRTGEPVVERVEGTDGDAIARFMAAMASAPAERVRRAVELCLDRAPDARTVLDVGGGPGHYARAFIDAGLEATLFDQPETIDYVADAYGLSDVAGLRLVPGDFMEDELPGGPFDIVLLSNILHIYSPDRNRALLRKVAGVTAAGGLAAIQEFVRGRSPRAARFAIIMLLRTEGGNTYGEYEYGDWLEEAGYQNVRIDDVDSERQLVTGLRADGANATDGADES
ncbi:MAG: class I SAM-dependent methyltransferase [Gemmatimonadota bacterium]